MLVVIKEAQGAKSWKEFFLLREKLSHGAVYLIDCHNITEKPDFYCFEYKFWKFPSFSVLICWKYEYKKSLLPNDLKWIQLYSSHAESVRLCWVSKVKFPWRANTVAAIMMMGQTEHSSAREDGSFCSQHYALISLQKLNFLVFILEF